MIIHIQNGNLNATVAKGFILSNLERTHGQTFVQKFILSA